VAARQVRWSSHAGRPTTRRLHVSDGLAGFAEIDGGLQMTGMDVRKVYPGARIAATTYEGDPHGVVDPATGAGIARIRWVGRDVVDDAVRAAAGAWWGWEAMPPRQRARSLRLVADDLRADADRLGQVVMAETGKRYAEARAEVLFSADYFDWFAEAATAVVDT